MRLYMQGLYSDVMLEKLSIRHLRTFIFNRYVHVFHIWHFHFDAANDINSLNILQFFTFNAT